MNYLKVSLISGILVLSSLPSLAANRWLRNFPVSSNPKKVYQKNKTTVGGSRFYCQNPMGDKNLELVIPEESVVHLTASESPSFYYYSEGGVNDSLIFSLVDLDKTEPLVEKPLIVSKAGYHKISLPPEVKLKSGKTYIWNIAIPCSNDPENFREVLRAGVKYMSPSSKLTKKIQDASSEDEKIQIYTEEGIWYDAIDLVDFDKLQ